MILFFPTPSQEGRIWPSAFIFVTHAHPRVCVCIVAALSTLILSSCPRSSDSVHPNSELVS